MRRTTTRGRRRCGGVDACEGRPTGHRNDPAGAPYIADIGFAPLSLSGVGRHAHPGLWAWHPDSLVDLLLASQNLPHLLPKEIRPTLRWMADGDVVDARCR